MKTDHHRRDRRTNWSQKHRASERREQVLTAIRDANLPLRLSDLARILADGEATRTDGNAPQIVVTNEDDVDPDHVQVHLHHVDLPKLKKEGKIEYDPSRRLVL